MKSQKLVNELNDLLASAAKEREDHKKTLRTFFRQFKDEEQDIRKKLRIEDNKASRKKLKKKLGMVQEAYGILNAA